MADPSPSRVLDQMEIDDLSDTATLGSTTSDSTSTSSENSSLTNVAAAAAAALPQSTSNWDEMIAAYQARRDREYHYNIIPVLDLLRHLRERGIQPCFRDALVAMALVDD